MLKLKWIIRKRSKILVLFAILTTSSVANCYSQTNKLAFDSTYMLQYEERPFISFDNLFKPDKLKWYWCSSDYKHQWNAWLVDSFSVLTDSIWVIIYKVEHLSVIDGDTNRYISIDVASLNKDSILTVNSIAVFSKRNRSLIEYEESKITFEPFNAQTNKKFPTNMNSTLFWDDKSNHLLLVK